MQKSLNGQICKDVTRIVTLAENNVTVSVSRVCKPLCFLKGGEAVIKGFAKIKVLIARFPLICLVGFFLGSGGILTLPRLAGLFHQPIDERF